MENQKVWLPDPAEGYVLGIIEDIHQDSVTAKTIRHPQKVSRAAIMIIGMRLPRLPSAPFALPCLAMLTGNRSTSTDISISSEKSCRGCK